MPDTQNWKGSAFSIERKETKTPGTVVLNFAGPFTARDMYGSLTPAALESLFSPALTSGQAPASKIVIDLSGVPYMDSMGLGMIVTQFVHCKGKDVRMIVTGLTPRVHQLFELTKIIGVIPIAATVEEAICQ
jgi:anti-anti-sigma factor